MPGNAPLTFHRRVCKHLVVISANGRATTPRSLLARSPPRLLKEVVYDELVPSLPVNCIAHVLEQLDSLEIERRFVSKPAHASIVQLLMPYYVTRLRKHALDVVRTSIVFRDTRISVQSVADAYIAYEHERTNRRASPQRRLSVPVLHTMDVLDVLYTAPSISGLDFSYITSPSLPVLSLFTNLVALRACTCSLVELSPSLGDLRALTTLALDDNQLSALPLRLGELHSLETFSASGNALVALPALIVAGWPRLRTLAIARNRLVLLPAVQLAALPVLESIDASENELVEFPRALGSSRSLSFVSLQCNRPVPFDTNEFGPEPSRGSILIARRLRCFL